MLLKIDKLHNDIETGNIQGVKEFSDRNPNFRLCCGTKEISALERAIVFKKLDIYAFLYSKGFYTNQPQHLRENFRSLTLEESSKFRKFYLKYVVENPESYIGLLMAKCNFDPHSPISNSDIREMLLKISEQGDENVALLKVASQVDLKIVFDYKTKSVKSMIPKYGDDTLGVEFHHENQIYVGKNEEKLKRYSTFVHELMHIVFFLIYENKCLPFCENDKIREEKFDKVFEETLKEYHKDGQNTDKIISYAFQNSLIVTKKLELAVRVNEIFTRYLDEPEKVEKQKLIFSSLFDFNKNFVLPDLKIPKVYRLIKLNNNFGVIKKVRESEFQAVFKSDEKILNENEENLIDKEEKFRDEGQNLNQEEKSLNKSSKNLTDEKNLFSSDESAKTSCEDAKNLLKNEENSTKHEKFILHSNVPQLTLSRILVEIDKFSENKLDLKVKNIFIDSELLIQNNLKMNFLNLLREI
jgi:hypothetical protein